jgi:hypothetical protein
MRWCEPGNRPQRGPGSLNSPQVNHLTALQDGTGDTGTSLAQLERVTTAEMASDAVSQGVRGLRRTPQTVALPDCVER